MIRKFNERFPTINSTHPTNKHQPFVHFYEDLCHELDSTGLSSFPRMEDVYRNYQAHCEEEVERWNAPPPRIPMETLFNSPISEVIRQHQRQMHR